MAALGAAGGADAAGVTAVTGGDEGAADVAGADGVAVADGVVMTAFDAGAAGLASPVLDGSPGNE